MSEVRVTRFLSFVSLAIVCVLLSGCSGDDPAKPVVPPGDELEYELFPSTMHLTEPDLKGLTSEPDGTLTFEPAPSTLDSVKIGSILLAGQSESTPRGLLRAVYRVERSGDALVLKTAQAPLQLAFRKLHVKLERTVDNYGGQKWTPGMSRPLADIVDDDLLLEAPLEYVLFNGDGDLRTKNDQAVVNGSLGGGFHYRLSIDLNWGDFFNLPAAVGRCLESIVGIVEGKIPNCTPLQLLPEVIVEFDIDPIAKARASFEGSASLKYEKTFNLATIPLGTIPLGPLVFVPSLDVMAKVEGKANAQFKIGAHGVIEADTGITISSRSGFTLEPLTLTRTELEADETEIALTGSAKVSIGPRLNFMLYDLAGPYAMALAYAEIEADVLGDPCWKLRAGLDGGFGVKVQTPSLPVIGSFTLVDESATFPIASLDLASGACVKRPEDPPRPPGSGPNDEQFASPEYVPWMRLARGVGDYSAVDSPSSPSDWSVLERTIDHRFIALGRGTDALVKFDEEGQLIWSRRYRADEASQPLRLIRAVSSMDAGLMVLAESRGGELPSLLKLGQFGGVHSRHLIELAPETGCQFTPSALVQDSGTGFFVIGGCVGGAQSAIVHVDADHNVLGVHVLADNQMTMAPSTALSIDSDLVVFGTATSPADGEQMFAARLGPAGEARFTRRYRGCDASPILSPRSARAAERGEVTVVGSGVRSGFLLRLRQDGSVAVAGFPSTGGGASKVFSLDDAVELPVTGFVATASTVDLLAPAGSPAATPSLALVGLDAIGRPLWAKTYSLPNARPSGFGALHLPDDGGVVVSGIAGGPSSPSERTLYAMKPFAKNGELPNVAGVTVQTLETSALDDCGVTQQSWPVTWTSGAATLRAVQTVGEDAALTAE